MSLLEVLKAIIDELNDMPMQYLQETGQTDLWSSGHPLHDRKPVLHSWPHVAAGKPAASLRLCVSHMYCAQC
jgi:hypothetical protein